MSKVELLAPAGNYETMVGAFNAGADAVYLGGEMFGARAYADNFTTEQIVDAIKYAHLLGKKIYLTVNTLVKEKEFENLHGFIEPFANAGLDGVIVQDFGVFRYIREHFPNVELHASTQMTLTGQHGASLLKRMGATRVVPARELTLEEIKNIKAQGIEVEAFIHGAMCYCYSGACLFSSMIGPRSGNRGRCAQPCRLPYSFEGRNKKDETYPLSLKDMCVIDIIPDLIDAGIDSFKIEGRMKKPEYAAGVVSVYRKYIDSYLANGRDNYRVSDKDREILKSLYLRTEISQGYYNRHNGPEMVTMDKPSYNGIDQNILQKVSDKYLQGQQKVKVDAKAYIHVDRPLMLTLSSGSVKATVKGDIVTKAQNRPMGYDSLAKSLSKFGGTFFELNNLDIDFGDDVFVPVKALNELRRVATSELEDKLIGTAGRLESAGVTADATSAEVASNESENKEFEIKEKAHYNSSFVYKADVNAASDNDVRHIHIHVRTMEQLLAISNIDAASQPSRIYMDILMYLKAAESNDFSFLDKFSNTSFYVALPYIYRQEKGMPDDKDIELVRQTAVNNGFEGVLIRNLEEYGYFLEKGFDGLMTLDYGVYIWNHEAYSMYDELDINGVGVKVNGFCYPHELTRHENGDLSKAVTDMGLARTEKTYCIYGRVPMMISAGCVKNTCEGCSGKKTQLYNSEVMMTDRMNHKLTISTECRYCYNIIWNTVPNSLHKVLGKLMRSDLADFYRIDFTIENGDEAARIYNYMLDCMNIEKPETPDYEFTTGHYKQATE